MWYLFRGGQSTQLTVQEQQMLRTLMLERVGVMTNEDAAEKEEEVEVI